MLEMCVDGELGSEGIISSDHGEVVFRRCEDGLCITEGHFTGSGFIVGPVGAALFFPSTVNGIPVTEIRQKIKVSNILRITVEAFSLKRAYLQLEIPLSQDIGKSVTIEFYGPGGGVDYCQVECRNDLYIGSVDARYLRVNAEKVILKGHAYSGLERVVYTGKVYPFIYSYWDAEVPNTDYFSETASLKTVDGSLSGDECWIFRGCTSLEKVHLSNGITRIPARAFENCSSLSDLYVPDTVTEIGEYAFSGCTGLKTIHLPSGIKTISKGMFLNCRSLTKCFLSDDIEYIEDEAFRGCSSMRKPWMPANIKSISGTAFDDPEWAKF